jgi:hypothetical protein
MPTTRPSTTCGCRKLVRTADLRLCPSGGHGLMAFQNCAIHPNRPVGDAPGTPRDRLTAEPRDRTVSAYSGFERSARSSGLERVSGRPGGFARIRSCRAKPLLSLPGRISGTHKIAETIERSRLRTTPSTQMYETTTCRASAEPSRGRAWRLPHSAADPAYWDTSRARDYGTRLLGYLRACSATRIHAVPKAKGPTVEVARSRRSWTSPIRRSAFRCSVVSRHVGWLPRSAGERRRRVFEDGRQNGALVAVR